VVFFRCVDCFNCEIARKAMLAQPDAIHALGLRWFHSNAAGSSQVDSADSGKSSTD
jgi:hypothetical protein